MVCSNLVVSEIEQFELPTRLRAAPARCQAGSSLGRASPARLTDEIVSGTSVIQILLPHKCLQEDHSVSAPVGNAVSLLYRRFSVSIFFHAEQDEGTSVNSFFDTDRVRMPVQLPMSDGREVSWLWSRYNSLERSHVGRSSPSRGPFRKLCDKFKILTRCNMFQRLEHVVRREQLVP